MQITRNFTFSELTDTSYKELLAENIYYAVDNFSKVTQLANFAQKVRDILNTPMTVTSAVRCPNLNAKVGGSNNSQHLSIEAIDFITKKMDLNLAFNIIRNSNLPFGQLILEENNKGSKWIHISIGDKREVLEYQNGKYSAI